MMRRIAIEVKDLEYRYEKQVALLNNINLKIYEGSIVTILGKNGVGKTTFLDCIMGFNSKYRGSILVYGENQQRYTKKQLASMIAFVPQIGALSFDYTVEEFVLMGCVSSMGYFSTPNAEHENQVKRALKILGIENLRKRSMYSLSGGEKQLVYIARALAQQPKIIVLDEPTSALDFGNSMRIISLLLTLKSQGYTIVLTCHNPDFPFMLHSDVVAIMPNGETVCGEVELVLTDKVLSELYEAPIKRVYLHNEDQYVCIKSRDLSGFQM